MEEATGCAARIYNWSDETMRTWLLWVCDNSVREKGLALPQRGTQATLARQRNLARRTYTKLIHACAYFTFGV